MCQCQRLHYKIKLNILLHNTRSNDLKQDLINGRTCDNNEMNTIVNRGVCVAV